MQRFLLFAAMAVLSIGIGTTTMQANDTVCKDDVELQRTSARSGPVDCCDDEARFKAAADAVKTVQSNVAELCAEAGFDHSAIARICVNYREVDNGRCVAVATAWYTCGCCAVKSFDLDECKYDEKACDNNFSVERYSVAARYKCCERDSRWDATYDTMKKAYSDVRFECSLLDCLGGLGVRGFQIDYSVVDADEGVCAVKSTIIYSCCCVCE